jgi:hypothetical protein
VKIRSHLLVRVDKLYYFNTLVGSREIRIGF